MSARHAVAVAIVGALIGLWISPGRAYAEPPRWSACKYEDGSGQARCVWDGRHMGNGVGRSAKVIGGGTDGVRYVTISHRRAHRLIHGGAR